MKKETSGFAPDPRSLRFRLWAYFAGFAIIILVLLWFLQIFFLNHYYEAMKINETNKIANVIATNYGSENFYELLSGISASNDLYIQVEMVSGDLIYSPVVSSENRPPVYMYFRELQTVKEEYLKSGKESLSVFLTNPGTEYNTLAYVTTLGKGTIDAARLYIFTPLYPVESTINILKSQLIYITIISLLFAMIIGIYLSVKISGPLRKISKSAMKLAEGEFGTTFEGGSYTEIRNLADTLTYTSMELEKASNQQKDLMANVSHDLRTPLTMVKSYAEMIRDISGDNPEKRNEHLQVIISEADRLNVLVSDMLSLSRLQTGAMVLEKKIFSMKSVAEEAVASLGILTEQEGYNIILNCPEDIKINGDESKIRQVLSNLLTNGVKYCGLDKTIIITIEERQGRMHCSVADHGMGISPDEIDHIWDRYYKSSTNHVRSTKGTGLGLSIVKEIVLLHGGTYGVNSTPGEGSDFWFEIPKNI